MMKQFIKLYSIFLLLVSAQTVNAVTLTTPDPAQNNQIQSIESPVNISVVGSLYLDFSVFSVFDSFAPEGLVSLNADRVFIYPASRTPEIEDLSSISVFDSLPTQFGLVGDALFFSDTPILDGNFTATENIYIGDYSQVHAVQAVPVPAALWLFISSLSLLGLRSRFNS